MQNKSRSKEIDNKKNIKTNMKKNKDENRSGLQFNSKSVGEHLTSTESLLFLFRRVL